MVRLYRSLPQRYKVKISMAPGSHQHVAQGGHEFNPPESVHLLIRDAVTKQLNDKERVAAAMEVDAIMESINNCLSTAGRRGEK